MKHKWEIDVAVLLIFFKRAEPFEKTFDAVRCARPRTLLLWQDGPRADSDDMEGILQCREIADRIDWDCEVYRCYNEQNFGCDPSTFYSHKWAFSIVDKCIVLEDDFVANKSFFYFCKALLDKYEDDERINHICGMNMLGCYDECPYDYFFGFTGTNAWASWKRVIDGWDETYSFLQDGSSMDQLKRLYGKRFDRWYKTVKQRESTGVPYWESILCFDSILNSRLAIIASKNMVENVGMTGDSTHSDLRPEYLTKAGRRLFDLPTYELDFPLKHPPYMVADLKYYEKLDLLMGTGHPVISAYRRIYRMFQYIRHGVFLKKLKQKLSHKG